MGARICFTNYIHIAEKSFNNGLIKEIGYKDITPELLEEIEQDGRIKMIQISSRLPIKAYEVIDRILERRLDLSNLKKLQRIQLDNVPIDKDTLDMSVRKLLYP